MAELNNNELDDLFKEGSELHKFNYRTDAWDSMEGMLDRKERKKRMLLLLLTFSLSALIIGSFLFYPNKNKSQVDVSVANIAKSEITLGQSNQTFEINPAIVESTQKESHNSKSVEINVDKKEKGKSSHSKATIKVDDNIFNSEEVKITNTLLSNNQISNKGISTIKQASENVTPTEIQQNNISTVAAMDGAKNILNALRIYPIQDKSIPNLFFEKDFNFPITNTTATLDETKISPWSFGISVGPEISLVGKKMKPKFGYSVGIEVAYQLNSKFSLKTGIGFSAKNYVGLGTDYSTPDDFWTDDIQPLSVEATCQVFEIPLAISYFKNGMNSSGFFADLGINAYLIGDEWYDYNYDPNINNPSLRLSFNEHMSNKRVLGSVQISFGYQKYLSKNWRLQIAPYAKIPLNGFGHGQVKLFSQGIKLSAWFSK